MKCVKCHKEIPDQSVYCNFCGKKQKSTKAKYHKRPHGTGTICKDTRYKKQWIAHAPATKYGNGRIYVGSYATRAEAQTALDDFIRQGRPDLYNATLQDIFTLWSETHYRTVSKSAVNLYNSMWKRFGKFYTMPMRDIRTVHFQEVVNTGTSKSACSVLKVMAVMLCRYAMENDIIGKNYAEFVKVPKFEKKEKKIFSREDIEILWKNSDSEKIQMILILIYTGLRIGEMLNLKKSDLHIADGYIVGGEKTKAGKNRIVPLPQNISEIGEFLQKFADSSESERIFPMTESTFRNDCFYSGLTEIGLEQQENLQKIIGHSDFSTTAEIYIHQDIETLKDEMSKIKK